jgi:putative hemolysin
MHPNAPRNPLNTADLLAKPWQRKLYRPVQPLVERLFDLSGAWQLYAEAGGDAAQAGPFAREILRARGVEWSLPSADLEALRARRGPLVIAANHPYGGIDAFVLIALLEELRGKHWKIFSNQILQNVCPLAPHRIPVDALGMSLDGQRTNTRALRVALQHLGEGGCLALFPARRVAYRDPQLDAVVDFEWSNHALKLAARTGASLVGLHISGHNSERFIRMPTNYPRLRGLMLCRELTHSTARQVNLRIAMNVDPQKAIHSANDPRAAQKMRARVHLEDNLRALGDPKPPPSQPETSGSISASPSGTPPPSERFRLFQKAPYAVYLFRGDESPGHLEKLGRARAITFRAAGQGTDQDVDLSAEDDYYHHLIVWDSGKQQLAGAYRIGIVPDILAAHGQAGLYLDHVFHIDPAFYQRFPRSLELSRSFVLPDYQKDNRVLPLLWQGLAAAANQHGIDTLFGSVTISDTHHPASRALLVEYLKNNYAENPETRCLIRARQPFVPRTRYHSLVAAAYEGEGISALNPLIQEIEDGHRSIPPLMRYYCQLGAKYIDYHVEADFGNALYCLLRVHLPSIPAAYQRRFRPPAPDKNGAGPEN